MDFNKKYRRLRGSLRILALAVAGCVIGLPGWSPVSARGGSLEEDRARLTQLEDMAYAMQKVEKNQAAKPMHRVSGMRRFSSGSEVHFRFLTCLTALDSNGRDTRVLVPVQFSGSSYRVQSGQPSKRDSGSDVAKVRILIKDFLDKKKAKAKIEIPRMKHGSTFALEQMVRDEIHRYLSKYFPDMEILGEKRYLGKRVILKNETDETIRVWWRFRINSPRRQCWLPPLNEGLPVLILSPNQSYEISEEVEDSMVSRMRIWAKGVDTGDQWNDYREKDLWLVKKNEKHGGDRVYYAEKPRIYRYVFKPHTGERVFTERVLKLKNETPEPLTVSILYHTQEYGGILGWRRVSCTIPSHGTITPRCDGYSIRTSRVYLSANSSKRRFQKHSHPETPLWLVAEHDGQRNYLAEKVGTYQYVFQPFPKDAIPKPSMATAKWRRAGIRVNRRIVKYLPYGEKLKAIEVREGWVKVEFPWQGKTTYGFMRKRDVTVKPPMPAVRPQQTKKNVVVITRQADVKMGSDVVGRARQGQQFEVYETRTGWHFVELPTEAGPIYGWIDGKHVREEDQ